MAERKPLISGNWKMHMNHLEAIQLIQKLSYSLDHADYDSSDVSIHPPFTNLRSAQTVLDADNIPIALGAQHCHWESTGAFTGEVSPAMLAKLAVSYVIAGHSERRQLFGETDENVNRRLRAILAAGMTPIMCCGETLEEREAGKTEACITAQVDAGLAGLKRDQVGGLVIAYEPVWAIGTGRTATPADAQAGCGLIRERVGGQFRRRRRRRSPHPVRRLGQAHQHRRPHGSARHRRRPSGRRLTGSRQLLPHRPLPTPIVAKHI